MKTVINAFAIVIAFVSLTSMTLAIGEFKFAKETHDFGKIPHNKPATFEFAFSNEGDAPIIISEVVSSCGCSVAEFTKTPIKPSGNGTIKVTFNAAVTGPFTKSFTVKSNTKTPVKILTIKGIVE